jgi:hypothetical protein
MIVPTQVTWLKSLSPIPFQASPLVYALKRTHIRAISLRCAKISQPDSFILFVNLVALFCNRFKALAICWSLNDNWSTAVGLHCYLYRQLDKQSYQAPKLYYLPESYIISKKGNVLPYNFHSCTMHFDVLKSFICPTNTQLNCFKTLKFTLRFYNKCSYIFRFNQTIIREPTVCASPKLQCWRQLKYFVIELFGHVAAY